MGVGNCGGDFIRVLSVGRKRKDERSITFLTGILEGKIIKLLEIGAGTTEIRKLIIARELFKEKR